MNVTFFFLLCLHSRNIKVNLIKHNFKVSDFIQWMNILMVPSASP